MNLRVIGIIKKGIY